MLSITHLKLNLFHHTQRYHQGKQVELFHHFHRFHQSMSPTIFNDPNVGWVIQFYVILIMMVHMGKNTTDLDFILEEVFCDHFYFNLLLHITPPQVMVKLNTFTRNL